MIGLGANKMIATGNSITVDLKTGLLAIWEMDETSGTSIIDSHGAFTMTSAGTPTLNQSGTIDKSILYNGSTQYLTRNAGDTLSPVSAHSVSSWIYRTGNGKGSTQSIYSRYYSSTGHRFFILSVIADEHATLANRLGWYYYDSSNLITQSLWNANGPDVWTNNWMHVVGTRNGSNLKLYVNGELKNSITGGNGSMRQNPASYAKDNIGSLSRSSTTPDSFFQGKIDQTASWSVELTQEQVNALYNSGNGYAYSKWK